MRTRLAVEELGDLLERPILAVLAVAGVDALIFVLTGPTPFQPLGVLATYLTWNRRGVIASAVPYKVTFAMYAVGGVLNMLCNQGVACPVSHGEGLATTLLINSTVLAVFRF